MQQPFVHYDNWLLSLSAFALLVRNYSNASTRTYTTQKLGYSRHHSIVYVSLRIIRSGHTDRESTRSEVCVYEDIVVCPHNVSAQLRDAKDSSRRLICFCRMVSLQQGPSQRHLLPRAVITAIRAIRAIAASRMPLATPSTCAASTSTSSSCRGSPSL